jgi:hypothetical protein
MKVTEIAIFKVHLGGQEEWLKPLEHLPSKHERK